MRLRAAFIGLSFHQKTQSSKFFIDIIKQHYALDIFFDESWLPGGAAPDWDHISEQSYDLIIFWQYFRNAEIMHNIRCPNKVFVPMYDGMQYKTRFYWKQFKGVKIVSFCFKLHEKFVKYGLNSFYIQYYPRPMQVSSVNKNDDKLKVFFWLRTGQPSWKTVKGWLQNAPKVKVHLHLKPDPLCKVKQPDKKDIEDYNITITDWFEHKNDYLKKVSEADIFIAPRLREGIGMSFLEAMSLGKCVIGFNKPVLNEYIWHNKNGLLFSKSQGLAELPIDRIHVLGKEASESIKVGYFEYQDRLNELIRYLNDSQFLSFRPALLHIYILFDYIIQLPIRAIKKMKLLT